MGAVLVWVWAAAVAALLAVVVVLAAQRESDGAVRDADSCVERVYRLDKATRNALHALRPLEAEPASERRLREALGKWPNLAAGLAGVEGCDVFLEARATLVDVHNGLVGSWSECQTRHGVDWWEAWVADYGAPGCGQWPSWPIGL